MMIRPKARASILLISLLVGSFAKAQQAPPVPEFQVNTYTTDYQIDPTVAMDASGGYVVAWASFAQDGASYGVFGQRYASAGTPLGGEFQVNSYTTGAQRSPALAVDSTGAFVVAWSSEGQDGLLGSKGVFGQRYDSTGATLGAEFRINSYTTNHQAYPAVAMDPSGSFVVVWASLGQDGSDLGVFGQRYDSTGSSQGGEFQVNAYTTAQQNYPVVAADPTGGFVVAWQSFGQDGSGFGIFAQRYDSTGSTLGGEFQVNAYTSYPQFSAAVAADSNGGFVVAWASSVQDGFGAGVFGQRYDSMGSTQGVELQVNTYTTSDQRSPTVSADPASGFVVAWQSFGQDGSGFGVFGQRYDSAGSRLGGEFRVNSYSTSAQVNPTLSMDPNGGFIVTWESDGQDGSSYGVFGQSFCPEDVDADLLCDAEDVIITSPLDGATLDCSDAALVLPTIEWDVGNYDKFRAYLGSDPGFSKGRRVTSGDTLLKDTEWTPSEKKWRRACDKALAADPNSPVLYVEVLGVDIDLSKGDPYRKTFSQVVQVDVQP